MSCSSDKSSAAQEDVQDQETRWSNLCRCQLWEFRLRQEHLRRQIVNPSICRHCVAFHVLFASFCRQASLILGVGNHVIRYIFQQLANFFVPLIDKLNGSLVLGRIGKDIKLDKISFRSVGRRFGKFGSVFLAVVRRRSSLVWIHRLPYRITRYCMTNKSAYGSACCVVVACDNQTVLLT